VRFAYQGKMNSIEELLYSAIQEAPGDWGLRLDLGRKLSERGALDEAEKLISEGMGVPRNETELEEALEIARHNTLVGNWEIILNQYLAENPTSGLVRRAVAGNYLARGDSGKARGLYRSAIELNPALRDLSFEESLSQLSPAEEPGPIQHVEVVPAAAAPVKNIEVVPAATLPAGVEVVPAAKAQPEIEVIPPSIAEEKIEPEPESQPESESESVIQSKPELEIEPQSESDSEQEPEEKIGEAPGDEPKEDSIFLIEAADIANTAEREPDKKEKLSALYVAIGVHVLLVIYLAYFVVADTPPAPPQFQTSVPVSDNTEVVRDNRKRTPDDPSSSSVANQMEAVTSFETSDFALPSMDDKQLRIGPVGMNDGFGPSMSFGSKDGGVVSFFGSRAKARKIVFVVDVSASMKKAGSSGKRRFDLMKEELRKSVQALPAGVFYQIIFFNGPAWFAGQSADKGNWHEKNARNFWSYKNDNDAELPKAAMMAVKPNKIRQSLEYIDAVQMDYGTDWRSPLKMAMNLEPDLIFFMTDGEVFENPDKKPLVQDLLEYNVRKSNAKINCISLMEIGAYEMMNELAEKTKGEISLVLEDSKILKGFPLNAYVKKNK